MNKIKKLAKNLLFFLGVLVFAAILVVLIIYKVSWEIMKFNMVWQQWFGS